MPESRAKGPERRALTFDELFAHHNLTPTERTALVWHLAAYRARKTVEALLKPRPTFDPRWVLRAQSEDEA